MRIVTFTGHRSLPTDQKILKATIANLKREFTNVDILQVGMQAGWDHVAACIAINMGKEVHGFLPNNHLYNSLSISDRSSFRYIRDHLKVIEVFSEDQTPDWSRDYLGRNDMMLDRSKDVIAVYDGRGRGGTLYVCNRADRWVNCYGGVTT